MILTELHYFPSVSYMSLFLREQKIVIEQHGFFEKQSYRNRCYLLTANGVESLSIPVCRGNSKTCIRDIQIDYSQKWVNRHWNAIQSAYGKAPFFEYYAPALKNLLFSRIKTLFELNVLLLTQCLIFLDVEDELSFTESYSNEVKNSTNDLRAAIHPKKQYLKSIGYEPTKYVQVFGNKFVKNLSVLDILFCEGSSARQKIIEGITG